ncbi:MAG TPA: hypothetical protein VI792_05005 [Candidatus Eisenbacteria bacterium]
MSDREHDTLIEAALTAHRERDPEGRLIPPPAWWDLPPQALDELFRAQVLAREVERRADAAGWSGTVRAVMARIAR